MVAVALVAVFAFLVAGRAPSNNRDWEVGQERLPRFTFDGDTITVDDLRDYRYTAGGLASTEYARETVDARRVSRVWFVVEPFETAPIKLPGVAHTYFVFDFADQRPITVSVEARRERNEEYSVVLGALNRYELMYIWATEEDATARRALVEHNRLEMYPLTLSDEAARALLWQVARSSHDLESRPRFYNSLTDNCTSELAKNANAVRPGAIPFNRALFMPGFSVEELYRLGFLPTDVAVERLPDRYRVDDLVARFADSGDLSGALRRQLPRA